MGGRKKLEGRDDLIYKLMEGSQWIHGVKLDMATTAIECILSVLSFAQLLMKLVTF
jgi:hypothetical protein